MSELKERTIYIDLPGESPGNVVTGEYLKVILRNSRDVIFNLKFGTGKTYYIEARRPGHLFYDQNLKKLGNRTPYKDGEQLHIKLSREFEGNLLLLDGSKIISKFPINKIDPTEYGADPKAKPAPIIFTNGEDNATASGVTPNHDNFNQFQTLAYSAHTPVRPKPFAAHEVVDHPTIAAIEVSKTNVAPNGVKINDDRLTDIDLSNKENRNWLRDQIGMLTASAAYTRDNWEWLRASVEGDFSKGFKLISVKAKNVKGNLRFYFSGYTNANKIFGRGGFGSGHGLIKTIYAGIGKSKSMFSAMGESVASSIKGSALLAIIVGGFLTWDKWREDVKNDLADLTASEITMLAKAVLATAAATLIIMAVAAIVLFLFGISLPVIVVGVLGVCLAGWLGLKLDAIDEKIGKKYGGEKNESGTAGLFAPTLRSYINSGLQKASDCWHYLETHAPDYYKSFSW